MSKADKMFEELGYKKDFLITYQLLIGNTQFEVCFNSIDKTYKIKKYGYDEKGLFYSKEINVKDTSLEIEKAINQKCKELGWIE